MVELATEGRQDRRWIAALARDPVRSALLLIALGTAVRIVLLATTPGNDYDNDSFLLVRDLLTGHGWYNLYSVTNGFGSLGHWPYPSGYLPVVYGIDALSNLTGLPFLRLLRLPPVVADVAIAWLVFIGVRARFGERAALGACALVALGPSFMALSGAHGQVDGAAVAFAVGAVLLWSREVRRRALWCGALIGLGASIKHPIGIFLLALLPTARSRREAIELVTVSVAVPIALLLPWALSTPRSVAKALTYHGLPGVGGLSMLVQPSISISWMSLEPLHETGLSAALQSISPVLIGGGVLTAGLVLWRARAEAIPAAGVMALTLWVFGVNFGLGYILWGLPFFLLAGRLREVAALQALLLVPTVLVYTVAPVGGHAHWVVYTIFVPLMLLALAAWAAAWLRAVSHFAQIARGRQALMSGPAV